MSYDISVGEKNWNVTYNLGKMFHEHIPAVEQDDGIVTNSGLKRLNNMKGKDAVPIIGQFFTNLYKERNQLAVKRHNNFNDETRGEPELSEKYDPKNGWGSMIGGLIFLGELMAECALHPESVIDVH